MIPARSRAGSGRAGIDRPTTRLRRRSMATTPPAAGTDDHCPEIAAWRRPCDGSGPTMRCSVTPSSCDLQATRAGVETASLRAPFCSPARRAARRNAAAPRKKCPASRGSASASPTPQQTALASDVDGFSRLLDEPGDRSSSPRSPAPHHGWAPEHARPRLPPRFASAGTPACPRTTNTRRRSRAIRRRPAPEGVGQRFVAGVGRIVPAPAGAKIDRPRRPRC